MDTKFLSYLIPVAVAISICVNVSAQSASEIAAAKSMARAYGYSESEINSALNDRGKKGASSTSTTPTNPTGYSPMNTLTNSYAVPDLENIVLEAPKDSVPIKTEDIYGHSFLKSSGLSIIPSYNAPVPEVYVLGPGDELQIEIWGAAVSNVASVIGKDGSISVPDLGPVYVAGMRLSAAESYLKEQLGRIYSGLSDSNPDTFLKVSISRIKGVSVNVSGEVTTPGVYTVPSLASIPSVLYMAGGVSDRGSVRNVTLYRHSRKIADFDLYDFLFKGQFDENLRLQDGDVISVAAYDNVATITGAVARPMRYEMTESETVKDLLTYAGGFILESQRTSVNVYRRSATGNTSIDVPESDFASFRLQDGDRVSVRSYNALDQNTVSIIGPVKYPGAYALGDDIGDLASLIKSAGGLVESAYTGKGQISRKDKNRQPEFLTFDLSQVLEGGMVIALQREDIVTLYSHDDMSSDRFVTIDGAVEKPGVYSYRDSLTVGRLINDAEGLSLDAYIARGQITREGSDGHPVIFPFDVQKAIRDTLDFEIIPGDAVRIYSIKELKKNMTITINGEVNAPGQYVYREGMTLANLVELAHGVTQGVDLTNVEIATRGGRERGTVHTVNLEENEEFWNEKLRPYDVISLRRLTYFRPQTAVTVDGEVVAPGTYVINKAQVRLSDVMKRVGGFTDESYPHGARLVRVLTEEEQNRQKLALQIAASKIGRNIQIDSVVLEDRYNIGIDLEKAMANPGSVADVILRAGDIIEVPQMNNTVKISGGVLFPNTVAYNDKGDWKYYISQAGGYTKLARQGKVYAVYLNGQVARRGEIRVEPGMEIIVPERKESEEHRLTPAEIASLASSTTSIAALVTSIIKMF